MKQRQKKDNRVSYIGKKKTKGRSSKQVKVAPGVIKSGISEINNIAQQRINQIMHQGGQEMERVLTKILRRGIKDIYQMPFRILGNFGKQQLQNVKNKVVK